MSHRRLLVLALIAGLPGLAGAQFTTFIPPQNKVADSVKAVVVAQQKAQVDSTVNMRLTNMKTWVDSAAGTMPAPITAADSAAMTVGGVSAAPVTMADGRRAPATASLLPLIALLGAGLTALGALLLKKDPEPARQRSSDGA